MCKATMILIYRHVGCADTWEARGSAWPCFLLCPRRPSLCAVVEEAKAPSVTRESSLDQNKKRIDGSKGSCLGTKPAEIGSSKISLRYLNVNKCIGTSITLTQLRHLTSSHLPPNVPFPFVLRSKARCLFRPVVAVQAYTAVATNLLLPVPAKTAHLLPCFHTR